MFVVVSSPEVKSQILDCQCARLPVFGYRKEVEEKLKSRTKLDLKQLGCSENPGESESVDSNK